MSEKEIPMTPAQPYLIRAFFDWILDNGMTPHLLVQTGSPEVRVPERHINDGKIVLNIYPDAVRKLELGNDDIQFNARFDGVSMHVHFPVATVLAIYAKENGQGMNFDLVGSYLNEEPEIEQLDGSSPDGDEPTPPRPRGRPNLKVVK